MAVDYIQIDTGLLNNTISDMSADVNNMKSQIESIYQDMRELDMMWDGPANAAVNTQFELDRQEFIQICDDINRFINKMTDAKNEYNNCENKVSEIVNAIRI